MHWVDADNVKQGQEGVTMQHIAHTDFYTLDIDDQKKRVYNHVFGTWGDSPEMSQFLEDWDAVLTKISDGYTMLTDARQFRLLSASWAAMTIRIRQKLFQAGITKIAEVLPERAVTKMQFSTISSHANDVVTKIFASEDEAEAWLDNAMNGTNDS
jgi:hypothetical protein